MNGARGSRAGRNGGGSRTPKFGATCPASGNAKQKALGIRA